MSAENLKPLTLLERLDRVQGRFHADLAPEQRAEYYHRDLAVLFEALLTYRQLMQVHERTTAELRAQIDAALKVRPQLVAVRRPSAT